MLPYNSRWEIGSHIRFNQDIYHTVAWGVSKGMYVVQFFMGSPYSFKRSTITEKDVMKTKKLLKRFPTSVFTHYPYTSNLAGSKNVLAWNGDLEQDRKVEFILRNLEYEVNVMGNFPKAGVVIHPGCHKDRQKGIEAISKSINKINFKNGGKLLLENCAGEGTKLGATLFELKRMLDGIDEKKRKHVEVCIDTQHLFSAGDYDLSKKEEVERLFQDFEKIIGLNKLALIHLNDSKVERGRRVDRHELIGEGYIWGKERGMESLLYLLKKCRQLKIPMVLETSPEDMVKFSD